MYDFGRNMSRSRPRRVEPVVNRGDAGIPGFPIYPLQACPVCCRNIVTISFRKYLPNSCVIRRVTMMTL
jgi:hypothetical protein